MSILEVSGEKVKGAIAKKVCPHCGQAKDTRNFYSNREWAEQAGRDLWCKDCVGRCTTKAAMKEYYWANNRAWSEAAWESAKAKAEAVLAGNQVYVKSGTERRERMLDAQASQAMPSTFLAYYKYEDHGGRPYEADVDEDEREWSDEWFGTYTRRELEWLNNFYDRLKHDEKGRELDFDHTLDDYAHNIAVQAMIVKKLQSDYRLGRCSMSEVKDAQTVLDTLNKSANFAACKKKADSGPDSLAVGEIALYLEQHGHPMTRKIEWEPDDVDKTIAELHHIVRAVGLDT